MVGYRAGVGGVSSLSIHVNSSVDALTLKELEQTLRFFYGAITVEDGTDGGVLVRSSSQLPAVEIQRVVDHFLDGHRPRRPRVIAIGGMAPVAVHTAPADDRIPVAPGVYLHGPEWRATMVDTRGLVRRHFAEEVPAPHVTGSALISRAVLLAAGYYRHFPNMVNAVARLRNNYWDGVSVAQLGPDQGDELSSFYVASDVVLNPVPCYHIYSQAHELVHRYGSTRFTIEAPAFRYESHNHGKTRLAEFSMFELVSMGTVEAVAMEHRRFVGSFERLFQKLRLPYRIVTASDGFFGDDPASKRGAQLSCGSKYEVRVPVDDGELSVGSINRHGKVFVNAFGLGALGPIQETCCAGVGFERLSYARRYHGSQVDGDA